MRFLLLITLCFSLTSTLLAKDWTGLSACGNYKVKGIVRSSKEGLFIVVNEKSQSEITISVPAQNEATLAPYVDKDIEASVSVSKKLSAAKALGTVSEINSRVPNPINPVDTGIQLISKGKCK